MAKPIMIQGTMSNAGKSLLVAALCRIFKQDGYSCAPFKSQNMALNSFITSEGLEMGRAQVMQAEAAGIEPTVLMNPILLKPTTDVGSQVIVNGRVLGNMKAGDYFRYKKQLVPEILNAYHTLAAQHDVIVIEGAGSPAEINLKQHDIVNMGMAEMVDAPVLLVGDIDRGGVFAQLLGTLMLLEEEEKQRVKGLIINKFRGDAAILKPGLEMLSQRCGKEVIGVVPYVYCDIEDEDSLSEKIDNTQYTGVIDIAVIKLPRMSNHTDFDVFHQYPGVSVRYVSKPEQLKMPDLVILPGTKSTISDLLWMRQVGLEAAIKKLVDKHVPIFGICGGYQMMGQSITDPDGVEAEKGSEIKGMALLKMATVFQGEKHRTQIHGHFKQVTGIFKGLTNEAFAGYEIHMGHTIVEEKTLSVLETGHNEGAQKDNLYGSYVHGLFDAESVSKTIVQALYTAKGLELDLSEQMDRRAYKEMQYDKLAAAVRESLDMPRIYEILFGKGQ